MENIPMILILHTTLALPINDLENRGRNNLAILPRQNLNWGWHLYRQ